jgi:hypothetical protein
MINRHRGIGWEYLHVAVDDRSRLSYSEILPDEAKSVPAPSYVGRSPGSDATASPSSAS